MLRTLTLTCGILSMTACEGPPPARDGDLFRAALAAAAGSPDQAATTCRAIQDPRSRSHCLVSIVELSANMVDGAICPTLEDELWRDECWFLAAEREMGKAPEDAILFRCEQAGRYRNRCTTHLWRIDAVSNLAPVSPTADAKVIASEVGRLRGMLDPGAMQRHTDVETPFGAWRAVLMFYLRHAHPLDPRVCDALSEVDQDVRSEWCIEQANDAISERLDRLKVKHPHLINRSVCRHSARTVPDIPWTWEGSKPAQWRDEPRMRAALTRWADEHCDTP